MISERTNEAAPSKMPRVEKALIANDVIANKGLYLLLQAPTTKQELLDFIDSNWKNELDPLIERHFGRKAARIRPQINLKRDENIYRDREKGASLKQLEDKYKIGYAEIAQILKRHKK